MRGSFVFVFVRLLIICVCAAASLARAEMLISQSRQFAVHSSGANVRVEKIPEGAVEVVPELLVMTAERVKQAVVAELPALAAGRTQIHIGVIDSIEAGGLVTIASERYSDAWRYKMAVPRVVEEARLVKGLINVLLLEFANRGVERNAELPAWLTEGLAEELLFAVGPQLVVGRAPTAWEASMRDLHGWTREKLRTNATPSFQDLTTSAMPPNKTAAEALYLAGNHLLVHSLLEMPNGRAKFAKFLQLLPRTWNWQTAFLQGFGFERMLDVEKWWSLTIVEFTTRDQRQAWGTEMSLRKLNEVLQTAVESRSAANALPEVRMVDLKSVLDGMDASLHREAISVKVTQLNYTVAHMAPAVGALALEYKRALEVYLKKRAGQKRTIEKLAALDDRRRALAERTLSSAR